MITIIDNPAPVTPPISKTKSLSSNKKIHR